MSNAAVAAISVALYILLAPGVAVCCKVWTAKPPPVCKGAKVRRCSSLSTM